MTAEGTVGAPTCFGCNLVLLLIFCPIFCLWRDKARIRLYVKISGAIHSLSQVYGNMRDYREIGGERVRGTQKILIFLVKCWYLVVFGNGR
jgi:hypothetical protein